MIVKNIDDFKGLRAVNRMAVFLSVFLPRSKGIQELTELLVRCEQRRGFAPAGSFVQAGPLL